MVYQKFINGFCLLNTKTEKLQALQKMYLNFEKKINLGIASCRKVKKLVGNSTIRWENGQKKSAHNA